MTANPNAERDAARAKHLEPLMDDIDALLRTDLKTPAAIAMQWRMLVKKAYKRGFTEGWAAARAKSSE